ncbi:TetR/AcrR family transcriptional regulator [Uliginosibacterium gangwonense]|uniref:TetR/AcrR family transcriptional regulator n=1 Tax=Uliginosibacterium gangwonense TaxID=392736 RepID=UPI0003721A2A|nr:TetR/AcrR family transcriptional regulator [Uliginosibacterium gangwonense]
MDNPSRSERSRKAILQAALAIIARDGPRQLTFDAIARESGISKGGVMHQFPTKMAVLKGLLDYQIEYFEDFSRQYRASLEPTQAQASLATQIATMRETVINPHSVAYAIMAALAEDPTLMSIVRSSSAEKIQAIKAETTDPDLALLRWSAAMGLALSTMFGMSPLDNQDCERLFKRLHDDSQWPPASTH